MNCFSASGTRFSRPASACRRLWAVWLLLAGVAACGVEISESADGPTEREYSVRYSVQPDLANGSVEVTLELQQSQRLLRELTFPNLAASFSAFDGDGELQLGAGKLQWRPPENGGTLRWRVHVPHERDAGAFDAWLGSGWGLFRAEDIIPRARTRTLKNSFANTTLSFELPAGWSVVTEYRGSSDPIRIERPDRRFDQPTGWILLGDIGVRRETIAGVRVAVAGPQGQGVRRMDMLALLNWTLPELVSLLPEPPARLTVISAGDPMWRGGLSAPASLYIHADRPLISENATSTLLHEVVHTALPLRASAGADWITEGLAEFYSLELLRRGGAITPRRYDSAMSEQVTWAESAAQLCSETSTGPTTALAVTVFRALDREIRDKTQGKASLDDLLRAAIAIDGSLDVAALSAIAATIIGEPSDALHIDNLPGCPKMSPGNEGS